MGIGRVGIGAAVFHVRLEPVELRRRRRHVGVGFRAERLAWAAARPRSSASAAMSRKPRMPGACGAPLSAPRRGAPDRSRVGGNCGSCIGTCGCCCRGKGGASARPLRGWRGSCRSGSCPSGGRSFARLLRRTLARRRCRRLQARRRRLARPRIGADVGAERIASAGAIAASARGVVGARSVTPGACRVPGAPIIPGARSVPGARRVPGARSVPGALGGLGLDLAHGLFQRQPLPGDFGFAQRRLHAAQLRDQRGARPLIERAAAFSGALGSSPEMARAISG